MTKKTCCIGDGAPFRLLRSRNRPFCDRRHSMPAGAALSHTTRATLELMR